MTREALSFLAEDPDSTGLFFDFDGTLSDVAERAEDARPIAGANDLLTSLGRRYALVAVVSGRDAGQLLDWLGEDIQIWGAHGAQHVVDGSVHIAADLEPYAERMSQVFDKARSELERVDVEGIRVEDKKVIVGLHYRPTPDPAAAKEVVERLARELSEEFGVRWSPSKMAVELKPPVDLSKEDVVLQATREAGLRAASYVGDDVVDLAAFDALDQLEAEGVRVVRVAVTSAEAPGELLDRADVVVEGPEGVLQAFEDLS